MFNHALCIINQSVNGVQKLLKKKVNPMFYFQGCTKKYVTDQKNLSEKVIVINTMVNVFQSLQIFDHNYQNIT